MSLAILSAIAITAAFVSCTSLGAKGVSRTLLPEGVDKAVLASAVLLSSAMSARAAYLTGRKQVLARRRMRSDSAWRYDNYYNCHNYYNYDKSYNKHKYYVTDQEIKNSHPNGCSRIAHVRV